MLKFRISILCEKACDLHDFAVIFLSKFKLDERNAH